MDFEFGGFLSTSNELLGEELRIANRSGQPFLLSLHLPRHRHRLPN